MTKCLDCGKEIYKYSKRCKSCSSAESAARRWDKRGRKPKVFCQNCGKEIDKNAILCKNCYVKYTKTQEYSQLNSIHFKTIWDKKGRKDQNRCIKCGIEISREAKYCRKCYDPRLPERTEKISKALKDRRRSEESRSRMRQAQKGHVAWNKGKSCPQIKQSRIEYYKTHKGNMTGKKHSKETKCKMSAARKKSWMIGTYDGVYTSPTVPELNLLAILDNLGIEYISQYRIGTYLYDVCIPKYKILIEYDGWLWHYSERAIKQGREELDEAKNSLALMNGFDLIRLRGYSDRDLTYEEIYDQLSMELWPYQGKP